MRLLLKTSLEWLLELIPPLELITLLELILPLDSIPILNQIRQKIESESESHIGILKNGLKSDSGIDSAHES